jgi:predicted Zn-dependent protease
MATKTFISHSSVDKQIVEQLAEKLQQESIWYDAWDMDLGDVLSDKIEKGIDEAKNFLIILSQDSLKSKWVQYELNMALIKNLEEADYKILIAKIDDVQVPLRLKPFLLVDCSNEPDIALSIYEKLSKSKSISSSKTLKRQFVNRHEETDRIQEMFYSDDTKFIPIVGFYGIGKNSFSQEAIKRIFYNADIVTIDLTPAHFGSRLTLELCDKAETKIPKDGATEDELNTVNLTAIETLLSKDAFVIFNRLENILDDSGLPNNDIRYIFEHFKDSKILNKLPFIMLSTRWPNLSFLNEKNVEYIKLNSLTDKHLSQILQSEIERIDQTINITRAELQKLASLLHGYPLAAKLAAPLIAQYGSVDYLTNNLHVINQLKIDIAEDIVSIMKLSEAEIDILELLSIFEYPLNPFHLSKVLSIDAEQLNKNIDNLAKYNLLESNLNGIILHPLVSNFYLKLARSSPNFKPFAERLSQISTEKLSALNSTNKNYIFWLTTSCRLLLYSGKLNEAKQLRHDLIGEIKNAAIKLYQKRDYETSLTFCDDYLQSRPLDRDVLFTKARCLSRVGQLKESEFIIENLIKAEINKFQLAKYNYALGRAFIENSQKDEEFCFNKAEKYFLESIKINEHPSALQSMGELLFRRGKLEEAAAFIERKLLESPTDPFAVSIYSDILWSMGGGKRKDAIDKIIEALKHQPKNPKFLFRAGRFLQGGGNIRGAYGFFRDAIMYDDSFIDARLSLADICLDIDLLEEAKTHIKFLSGKVKGDKLSIFESIRANLLLKQDDVEGANQIAKTLYAKNKTVYTVGLLAKIHIVKFKNNQQKGLSIIANVDKERAVKLINEGLDIDSDNIVLKTMLESL